MKSILNPYKEFILESYKNEPNATKIAKQLGVTQQTVSNFIKYHLGLQSLNPLPGKVDYFSNIDTYSKAYILGFIAADGCLTKGKNSKSYYLTITLKHDDKSVLEFIKSEIQNEHRLYEIKRPSSFDKSKTINHVRFTISHPQITQDLMNLGIVPNKTLIMTDIINNIPYHLRNAFIIGYFDGDGSVSELSSKGGKKYVKSCDCFKTYPSHNLSINIRGTNEFLNGICEHLDIDSKFIRQYDLIPTLTFANKKDILKFFKCYKNLDFYLERKHNVFLSKINHPSYDKYK